VHPFEFIIAFFSFIYALALTHLLLSITAIIRHRRIVVFSLPQALWMLAALVSLIANWISLWDFHKLQTITLGTIFVGFVLSVIQYLVCALVSPELRDDSDLKAYNVQQGRAYIGAFAALVICSLFANVIAGSSLGVQNWAHQNTLVLSMVPAVFLPLIIRKPWLDAVCAFTMSALGVLFLLVYYQVLK
jgi:hypothetical protein